MVAKNGVAWRNRIVGYGDVAPDSLVPNRRNWRQHPDPQQKALAGVLGEVGLVATVMVNRRTSALWPDGERGVETLVDGHLRVSLALQERQPTVPVSYVDLTPAEEAEVLATLDPLAAMATADAKQLDALLRDVATGDAAVQAMLAELAKEAGLYKAAVAEDPGAQVDRAAELEVKWGTARGQVWEVGRHRLMCGDSTEGEDVAKLLGTAKPFLTVTDPPYGVEYDANWRQEAAEKGIIAYAPMRVGDVLNDDRSDWSEALSLCPGSVLYCWSAMLTAKTVLQSIEQSGFHIRAECIWRKAMAPISRGHYRAQHESCWYAVRKGQQAQWIGDHAQTTVWELALDRNVEGGHSTQKPLECMARPIRNHAGDVYDPFLGSGTTMVAAEQLGRTCWGCDIDPAYVAVALERLAGLGLAPRLTESVTHAP